MVVIKPFRGFRPHTESQFDLYINPSEETVDISLTEDQNNSGVLIPKNNPTTNLEEIFSEMFSHDSSRLAEKAKKYWPHYISLGLFKQEEEKSIYIYRMHRPHLDTYHTQIGIKCLTSVKDLKKGRILGHESIFERPINKFVNRILKYDASPSSVYLMYEDNPKINKVVQKVINTLPVINFQATTGIQHTIWKVSDPDYIDNFIEIFREVKHLYVADGHHRVASAQKFADIKAKRNKNHTGKEDYNYFLATLFPVSQLQVMEFNRIVENVSEKQFKEFKTKIKENFVLESGYSSKKPTSKGCFGVYYNQKWYFLKANKKLSKKRSVIKTLDAYILQRYIFEPIFKIENPSSNKRIIYAPGIISLEEIEEITDKNNGLAFILYPMIKEDIKKIALKKEVVPPKSTWFEPKLLKGIVVRVLEDDYKF